MDLEVVGRHALFFDDDSMAAFVNSKAALVDWNSLLIDRYDVRHLLSTPPPPRSKRHRANLEDPESSLASQLDQERYLDLPASSPPPPDQQDDSSERASAGGYHSVGFTYGNTTESNDQKKANAESGFRPPFSVPEALLQSLPPTEKLHQIIARTATFVSTHGGQSEIVLRVKQGDNPTFGFLMPDHPQHAYFRFLVDHQELLAGKSAVEDNKDEGGQAGGALSLLGSAYGTGEDEDTKNETDIDSKRKDSDDINDPPQAADSNESEGQGATILPAKDETVVKRTLPLKDKASVIKRNSSLGTIKVGGTSKMEKEADAIDMASSRTDKLQSSALPAKPTFELPVVEPSSDLKKVIDKIVEFILRNGKEFEAVLAEQDVKYGRFPFLVPSNLYHPYYRKVLQEAEVAKSSGKGFISEQQEKKAAAVKESDTPSVGTDIPDDSSRKEKFKMVIGKPKKDVQEEAPKPAQPQVGVTVDAAAVAAILEAARRGIRNPNLGFLSSTSLHNGSQGFSSDSSSTKTAVQTDERVIPVPASNATTKPSDFTAASKVGSSEVGLTKDQKLKAERLKRAKMFVAMIKSGAVPLKAEPSRSLSVEPVDSGVSASSPNAAKEREGSLVPLETVKKHPDDDQNERRAKRNYRSRTEREENEDDNREDEKVEDAEEDRCKRKRHSHHSRDRHKHKHKHRTKDSSSKRSSRDRHKHIDISSDDDREHRRRHSSHRRRHSKSKSFHKHERDDSSEDEHRYRHRSSKHRKRERDSEEGEMESKSESDRSRAYEGARRSRESSVSSAKPYNDGTVTLPPSRQTDTSQVSEELRSKVRAMLMGTL